MLPPVDTKAQISRLIREDWGRLLAVLISYCGDFSVAEDCLQDAVVSALKHWPRQGLPQNPDAWLITAARRKAVDRARRAQTADAKADQLALWQWQMTAQEGDEDMATLPDHRLQLIFTCCHPALDEKSRVALTLRALGGLSTAEIAAAFVDQPATMAARLTRAKKKIRTAGIRFRTPEPEDLHDRIDGVLKVIYLIFNEGYRASSGPLTRGDLANEAIRLGRILSHFLPDHGETKGLLALMLLGESRRLARLDDDGVFVPLERQNRARWDRGKMHQGLALVDAALGSGPAGPYAVQAAISALHARAVDFPSTDWRQIVALYDVLLRLTPNPVLLVNQALALSYAQDASAGLALLDHSGVAQHLNSYQPYHSCRADLLLRNGQYDQARASFAQAIALSQNPTEKAHLQQRLAALAH